MSETTQHTPRIMQHAAQIEADIRSRGLQPGDGYYSTSEIARMLGVSSGVANRAMQLLVQRRLLSQRQRRGAVIAEGIMEFSEPRTKTCAFPGARELPEDGGVARRRRDGWVYSGTDITITSQGPIPAPMKEEST